MPEYTKEQIDKTKTALREHALMVRETEADDEDAVHLANDMLFLIAAFESAESELAEYKRKAVEYAEDSCSGCTALASLKARCAELEARLQRAADKLCETKCSSIASSTAPDEDAMGIAREAVDVMGREMLALGKEVDTSVGPMEPPEIQKDKAVPYLATLIEDYGRRVPRAMLWEIWQDDRLEHPAFDDSNARMDKIAAKYNVTIEEDPNDQA